MYGHTELFNMDAFSKGDDENSKCLIQAIGKDLINLKRKYYNTSSHFLEKKWVGGSNA